VAVVPVAVPPKNKSMPLTLAHVPSAGAVQVADDAFTCPPYCAATRAVVSAPDRAMMTPDALAVRGAWNSSA